MFQSEAPQLCGDVIVLAKFFLVAAPKGLMPKRLGS